MNATDVIGYSSCGAAWSLACSSDIREAHPIFALPDNLDIRCDLCHELLVDHPTKEAT